MIIDGWQVPPDDGDGNGKYDIYILNIPARGKVEIETIYSNGQRSSFMKIKNTNTQLSGQYCNQISEIDLLKMIILHEFGHSCQLVFQTFQGEFDWFAENTSKYLEWKKSS